MMHTGIEEIRRGEVSRKHESETSGVSRSRAIKRLGLSEPDRQKVLVEWNQTASHFPRDRCFHELVEDQVRRTPNAIAVECSGTQLTYAELNSKANKLAHQLHAHHVDTEILVGICLALSADLLVALLAVLKAGGAYVPLDPTYPRDRLAFMIRDSGMKVLLTEEKLLDVLPADLPKTLLLDAPCPAIGSERANPRTDVRAENLAYVIYTSGSTGTPKGVMIPHRGLVNYLTWAVKAYEVESGVGAPVHSSLSFDLTITALFTPLLAGRCVHMAPAEPSVDALKKMLTRETCFSLVKITPAHLELLCAQLSGDEVAVSTQAFVVGGEALFATSIESWRRCAPRAVIVNEYGPTETVVGCCVYFVPPNTQFEGSIPIGRPIANTQLYVLDDELEPVSVGETGELYIAGDGVARGYLNQPELTARQFIPNPFRNGSGSATMYKTGDLVRYLPDGNLKFVGRVDDQIKIRSYRIEPAEIEAALVTSPQVRNAAIVARPNASGDRQLVAYIVPRNAVAPSSGELRQHLKSQLPHYMVPAVFVSISALPLTANGKIDRNALPDPTEPEQGALAGSELERGVAELWGKALQCRVAPDDNFFDLGGDSLLAVRLVAQINQTFQANLDAVTLYQNPTARGVAAALECAGAGVRPAKLIPVRPGNGGAPVFFLNAPLEFVRMATLTTGHEAFYISDVPMPREAVAAALRFETKAFPTLEELVSPHTNLILESGLEGPCFLAGYSSYGTVAFEVARQLQRSGQEVDGIFLFDADMQASRWKIFKVVCARHARRTMKSGPAYLWRKVAGRIAREMEKRVEIETARQVFSADAALSNADVSWRVFKRIWDHALRDYRPAPLDCRGILFRAEISIYGDIQDHDGCLGWRNLFTRGLTVVQVPGDHVSMWKEPDAIALSKSLEACLQKLRQRAHAVLCSAPTVLAALVCSV